MAFWVTPALLKLYLAEPDSPTFEAIAMVSNEIVTASIAKFEARVAFRRKEAEGALPAGEADVCYQRLIQDLRAGHMRLVPESPAVEDEFGLILERCFSLTPPVFIRTNDALHLASARVAGETEFITADGRQAAAAKLAGLVVKP